MSARSIWTGVVVVVVPIVFRMPMVKATSPWKAATTWSVAPSWMGAVIEIAESRRTAAVVFEIAAVVPWTIRTS